MKSYSLFDAPMKVYGAPRFASEKSLERLPEKIMEELPHLQHLGRRCPGGRMEFVTNAASFTVEVKLRSLSVDIGMSLFACQSVQVMVGERKNAKNLGVVNPPDYETLQYQKTFEKSSEAEQVTLYFPRNEQLENIIVTVDDDALVTEAAPYQYSKPVVFYGSSITEGGCCCNVSNAYNAILSRWLDCDYVNMGFSGSARGEMIMADYLNTLDMSVFVYDYDHNAPTVDHPAATHKPFFDRIRERHPDLPIIMMTRPSEVYNDEMKARREVVKATYQAALEAGDSNVYFIDGESFYGESDRNLCSVDNCHPNDLGFFRMASVIRPVLETALKSSK